MNTITKDILVKALHTFWQAALAFLLLGSVALIDALAKGDFETIKLSGWALVLGAIAAGLSAVKTLLVNKFKS